MSNPRASIGSEGDAVELGSEHLVDASAEERASLLSAAANARNVAMLTGTHGVVALPLDLAAIRLPRPGSFVRVGTEVPTVSDDREIAALVRARTVELGQAKDKIGLVRANLELSLAKIDEGNLDAARESAEAAHASADHATAAHALLRMLASGRDRIDAQLAHVEHLATHGEGALVRADFLTEKARLLEARGGPSPESAAAYTEALGLVPDHAGALQGLEAALDAMGKSAELAVHLGRLAGLAGDREVSAWLHVERALVLDRRLGDVVSARAALDHALELEGGIGPVRQSSVDHAVTHRDDARLAVLLEGEAALEKDPARTARLELDAALAYLRTGVPSLRAVRLLERAHALAPTSNVVDLRVADELARLHDAEGRPADALRVRKNALRFIGEPREEVLALRAIATAAERAGALDDAVLALERARVFDADEPTLLAELDRLLVSAARHEARAVLWVRESALADEPGRKARALLVAAEASRAAGRGDDAAKHLQAAWVAAPGAPGVLDAFTERLDAAGSDRSVAERVALYERALHAMGTGGSNDKRLYYLEKIAWLWDDVAGNTARAARAYEDVVALDERRSSAIAGLASAASRAGDCKKLARALLAEAAMTDDDASRSEIRLRAAETLVAADPDRALALAEALVNEGIVASRASELVTALHANAGRWELVVQSLAERRTRETTPSGRTSLALAEASVLLNRLAAPDRAFAALEAVDVNAAADPAVANARLEALERVGDETRVRRELEKLADAPSPLETRVARLVRAAEIEERREGGDVDAVRLYERAREILPNEPLLRERLVRLGARANVSAELVPPLVRAVRSLDVEGLVATAEPLLASEARDIATLRTAERLARRARSAPQLANALALEAQTARGMMARRALFGLASLVSWTLPESDDLEPWAQLLGLGVEDVVVLDELVRRAWAPVRARNAHAIALSMEATRRRLEGASDDTERLVALLELARLSTLADLPRDVAAWAGKALSVDASSVTAAALLAKAAEAIGDRSLAIQAATSLSEIVVDRAARAALLRDAADLSAKEGNLQAAAELLERALEAHPDDVMVAARLAQLQTERGAFDDLSRALRRGVQAARTREAVVPMAAELADVAKNRLRDPLIAIEALERSREIASDHVPGLFLLAELYIGQRAWPKALEALGAVVSFTNESDEKMTALVGRASILSRVQNDPKAAEVELRAALAIDPHDARALRGLLKLAQGIPAEERAAILSRLVSSEPQGPQRVASLLELADVRRALGDTAGAEGALIEAASMSPTSSMLDRLRAAAAGDAETATRLVGRALARSRENGAPPSASWLVGLGELELGLGRVDEAVVHLEEAIRLEPSRDVARLALARGLAAKGRHETAAAALSPLLESPTAALDGSFVRLLGSAFEGAGRAQQAMVTTELRAVMGELDAQGLAALGARRAAYVTNSETLSAASLRSFVMPAPLAKHPVWEVAQLATGICGKLARVGLSEQGASTKNRIKPRAVHPLRVLFDRVARAFELLDVEIAVSDHVSAPVIAAEDVPWIIVPAELAEWPEPHAIAALARPLVRVALGVPWLGALPSHEVLAILVALARQVAPAFGATPPDRVEPLVAEYELRGRRAIDRRRRRALEELAPVLDGAPLVNEAAFADAVARTEARAAFLLSGDLRASLDAIAGNDRGLADALRVPGPAALTGILTRPVPRDLAAFALGGDATALRRSLGTLWD